MKRCIRLAALVACCMWLTGCIKNVPQPLPEGETANRWQAFETLSDKPAVPSVVGGSLRFGPVNDTRRVTYLLWSNGGEPLRLDVQAGVGATAAKVQVTDGAVLVYLPQEQKAYIGTDAPDKALRSLGIPLPLSVGELNDFLHGRYVQALGDPRVLSFRQAAKGTGIVYIVEARRGKSELELSPEGMPVHWKLTGGWDVTISYDEATQLPLRIDGVLPARYQSVSTSQDEYRLVLLIKDRQHPAPFPVQELEMSLPAGTPVFSLDD